MKKRLFRFVRFSSSLQTKTTKLAILFLSICSPMLFAQKANQDLKDDSILLDDYIKSKHNSSIIVFDSNNAKQFWIDKSVFCKDNVINIQLEQSNNTSFESVPLKIKLVNVNEAQDCKVELISKNSDVAFSVLNEKKASLSKSSLEEKFIDYNVYSSTFHLEDAKDFSFFIKAMSDSADVLSVKSIVLSFTPNKNGTYLSSPGTLKITKDNLNVYGNTIESVSDSSFSLSFTGTSNLIISKNKIIVEYNTFEVHMKVKNTGDAPVIVNSGFSPYNREGVVLRKSSYPYKGNNKILSVISSTKGSNSIIVDDYPEDWAKNGVIALNAKDDLSDIPNTSFAKERISEIKKNEDGSAEIILISPLSEEIQKGTKIRIHDGSGGYVYTNVQKINPGEEIELESTIKKDDSYLEYSPKAFSRGVYSVTPLIAFGLIGEGAHSVLISDYSISY